MAVDCTYVGDSIAVGLHMMDNRCAVHAKVGASERYIVQHFSGAKDQSYVIISMGSNDPMNPHNLEDARRFRKTIKADVVVWILPYNRVAAGDITLVAREFRDSYLDLAPIPTKDKVHPNYKIAHKRLDALLDEVFD